MTFYCIGDEDTVRGFQLAGVRGKVAISPAQATDAIQEVVHQPEIGVIIITEPLADGIRHRLDAFRLQYDRPLIVEIAGPVGPRPGHAGLQQTVQKVVGISLDFSAGKPL